MSQVLYPSRLSLALLPTPVHALNRLSTKLGGPRIWIKRDDLTGSGLTGNKVRKLEFSVAEAMDKDCDTLITCGGIQSNHCRATALTAARLGLNCHLVLRGEPSGTPDGNLFLDYLSGAEISYFAPEIFSKHLRTILQDTADNYQAKGKKPFIIPVGASDEIGLWGYIAACEELKQAIEHNAMKKVAVVTATGSGGTHAGLIAGNELHKLNAAIYAFNVCDNEEYFVRKNRYDLRQWKKRYNQELDIDQLPITVIDGYVGPGYAKAEKHIYELIKEIARDEGILLDPVYTAKAFYGMLEEIKKGTFSEYKDIIFIHTGGAFGMFAQREKFDIEIENSR